MTPQLRFVLSPTGCPFGVGQTEAEVSTTVRHLGRSEQANGSRWFHLKFAGSWSKNGGKRMVTLSDCRSGTLFARRQHC